MTWGQAVEPRTCSTIELAGRMNHCEQLQPRENNASWCVRCLSDMHKLAQDGELRTALHPTAPPSDCDLHGN